MKAVRIISKGSCHIGGRRVRIEGRAPIKTSFWPGGPPVVYDPNGDFQAGQMYVQYTRLEAALKNVQNIRGVIMLESSLDMDVNQEFPIVKDTALAAHAYKLQIIRPLVCPNLFTMM